MNEGMTKAGKNGAAPARQGPSLRRLLRAMRRNFVKKYVKLQNAYIERRGGPAPRPRGFAPLDEIARRAQKRTDISDHLVTLFAEALTARPRLIVELGVRGGDSTFVFERVAALAGARLVSVDIEDCAGASSYPGWIFERSDDVAFGAEFAPWCRARGIEPAIDVLFVDTSHEREHTAREIAAWFPHLSPQAKVFFHDTNLKAVYRRKDGSLGIGWDNARGVIAALEGFFGTRFDENAEFVNVRKGWLIRHRPWCAGLTILDRVPGGSRPASA